MMDRYVSASELQRLLSALLVVVTFIAIFTLFAFLVVPGLRNANRPLAGPSVSPPQGESGWLDATDYPAAKGYTIPPVDPKTVMTSTPDLIARGSKLYGENCAACHGPSGRGDGPAAKGLDPPPRNLTQSGGWKNGYQMEGLWKTLQEGIKGSGMVAYETLSKKDRMALVHYVQSLGPFDHGPEDSQKLEELAKGFASAGEVIPDRIPVASALAKLEGEDGAGPRLATLDSAPDIVRKSVSDGARAARALSRIPGWTEDGGAFARGIAAGVPANGFYPAVATYTSAEWEDLRAALAGRPSR